MVTTQQMQFTERATKALDMAVESAGKAACTAHILLSIFNLNGWEANMLKEHGITHELLLHLVQSNFQYDAMQVISGFPKVWNDVGQVLKTNGM